MIGELTKNTPIAAYQPKQEIIDLTKIVRDAYACGDEILNRSWPELNGYSVIDRMNKDQRTFQSFVDETVDNPDEAWKWIGTRSLARKKAFGLHAHMTTSYVVPGIVPQNSAQDEDREMANAMRDIVEWQTVNSNYRDSYLLTTMGMLVNPVTYMQADYCEVYQEIKERTDSGYEIKEILDEVLSGLNCRVWSADQILISNAYEQDIQRQKSIIKRRWVDYSELEAKYGEHDNWGFLQPGVNMIFNDSDGLFYSVKDDQHQTLVQEIIFENRRDDSEICFLGGIYFGADDVDWNPIKHRDNRNAPKYDFVPFGYHRVNEHFFYYASMMNEVGWDDKLIDAMYQVTMNREFIDLEQPILFTGIDKVDTSVRFPGAAVATSNPDAKAQPLFPQKATNPYNALQTIEDSMSEATISETQTGNLPAASTKATAIASADRAARILLSGVMKSLGNSVCQMGSLLVDIALQHLTTAEIDELTGSLKYREFVLENQVIDGKKMAKRIRFDEALMGNPMSDDQKKEYNMKLLEESGYPDNKQSIYSINPSLFSKMNYLTRIEVDEMMPRNQEFERLIAERMYTLLRQDPLIEPEALVRMLVNSSSPQNGDRLIAKPKEDTGQMAAQIMGGQERGNTPNLPALPAELTQGQM